MNATFCGFGGFSGSEFSDRSSFEISHPANEVPQNDDTTNP